MSLPGRRTPNAVYHSVSSFTSTGYTRVPEDVGSENIVINGAKMFAAATENEKKQMQDLNNRLGNYIQRVKMLEEQNHNLVAELEHLKKNWGAKYREHRIAFIERMNNQRKDIDAANRGKADVEVRVNRLREQIAEYRTRVDEVQRLKESDRNQHPQYLVAIKEAEKELAQLNDRFDYVKMELTGVTAENGRIWKDLADARDRLDRETIARIDYQSQLQQIQNEIDFLKKIHEIEVAEVNKMIVVAPADTKEFFKNEIALAIRDIRKEFDRAHQVTVTKWEEFYRRKVHELPRPKHISAGVNVEIISNIVKKTDEIKNKYGELEARNAVLENEYHTLQKQLANDQREFENAINDRENELLYMKSEYGKLFGEFQSLLDTKALLDTEIAIYRAMVEGEERRVGVSRVNTPLSMNSGYGVGGGATTTYTSTRVIGGGASGHHSSGYGVGGGASVHHSSSYGIGSGASINQSGYGIGGGASVNNISNYSVGGNVARDSTNYSIGNGAVRDTTNAKFQSTAHGDLAIEYCDPLGRYVVLENTSSLREIDISAWKLIRNIDYNQKISFEFPSGTIIRPKTKFTIFAGEQTKEAVYFLINQNESTWGMGGEIITTLLNNYGEEKAVHVQTAITSSI